VTGKELNDPAIAAENVCNKDETGVLLSVLSSLKVLVSRDDLRSYRGARVKRTLVTAHRTRFCRRGISSAADHLACCHTLEYLDHSSHSWMAFCVFENSLHRHGDQLVLDPACVRPFDETPSEWQAAKRRSRKCQSSKTVERERSCVEESEAGLHEIDALGSEDYCSVLHF
jgi:hypothetical protein